MLEIPTTQTNSVISPTATPPVDQDSKDRAEPLTAHVLANNKQTISLSVPGQAILVLDISDNKQSQQLQTGQKIQITIKQLDQSQLIITLNKVMPAAESIAEIPLSRDLAAKLVTAINFPQQLSEQLRFIEKNSPVIIGQARRLPNETIKLVTQNLKNITAALPGASLVALNKTFSLALIIAKDGTAQVQFTPLPTKEAPIVLQTSTSQLMSKSPQLDLTKLVTTTSAAALTKSANIDTLVQDSESAQLVKTPKIDMSLPRNQLWLRYQPLPKILSSFIDVAKAVSQIKIPLAINGTTNLAPPQTQPLPASTVTIQSENLTAKPSDFSPLVAAVKVATTLPQTTGIPLAASAHPLNRLPELQSQLIPEPLIKRPLAESSLSFSLASTSATLNSKQPGTAQPQLNKSNLAMANNASDSKVSHPDVLKESRATSAEVVINQVKNSSLQTSVNKDLNAITEHEKPAANQPKEQPQPTTSHLSLQKLNALLSAIKTPQVPLSSQPQEPATSKPLEQPEDAIIKIQSLTKQLQLSLPNMGQLTTAPKLPNLIEQFVRFDPLSPASISLSSLGPLAGALQLLLGGRASTAAKPLSPELSAQLKKILQQGKNPAKINLLQSLAQLGNISSFTALEETLVSLSGHLQLYQYQSQEQSGNNQQTFYFTLPTSESLLPQIEGQIEQGSDPEDPARKTWQLTLLLPIGMTDKLKATANLQGNNVELELTSNNEEMVKKAEFFTDFLRQRLESLGLTAKNISCKHAPLPKSLLQRPNQLVELII
jgi:hypothetical protein